MLPSKPDLLVLPFKAILPNHPHPLTLEQTLRMLRKGMPVQIERSHPGDPSAIGWTIFRRTRRKYRYENEPLFRFERSARKYIRKAYAIHYSLLNDDGMTPSHLNL